MWSISSGWLKIGVCGACPGVTVWVRLLDTLVGLVLMDTHSGVSILIPCAPKGLYNQPIIRVTIFLDWTGGEINELGFRVVRAVASCWCCYTATSFGLTCIVRLRQDRWKAMPTADVGSLGPGAGPYAALIIGCAVGGVGTFQEFGTDSAHKGWKPNWSARGLDVRYGEDWRRWSASSMHWAACQCQGMRTLEFWSSVICLGFHLSCMAAVSTSPMEYVRTTLGLAAVERNHGRSLTESAGHTWERTSLNVVSNHPQILACWYSSSPASFSCSQSSSHLSWTLAWVTACNCLRAMPKLSALAVCVLLSLLAWGEVERMESRTRKDKQWSPTELSQSASLVNGMTMSLSLSFSVGGTTWVGEYRSSQHRHSRERWNQLVEEPTVRVATSKKGGQKTPIFITTMASSGELHWIKVKSAIQGSTFAWSEWQKTVTIPMLPLPTPLVMRIAIGTNRDNLLDHHSLARAGDEVGSCLAPQLWGDQPGEEPLWYHPKAEGT